MQDIILTGIVIICLVTSSIMIYYGIKELDHE